MKTRWMVAVLILISCGRSNTSVCTTMFSWHQLCAETVNLFRERLIDEDCKKAFKLSTDRSLLSGKGDELNIDIKGQMLDRCYSMLNEELQNSYKNIEEIVLASDILIAKKIFIILSQLRFLKKLRLYAHLDDLTGIEEIKLTALLVKFDYNPAAHMEKICNNIQLKDLHVVYDGNPGEQTYKFLQYCTSLERLSVKGANRLAEFGDSDVQYLASMKKLKILDVTATKVTVKGIDDIYKMINIEKIFACNIDGMEKYLNIEAREKVGRLFYWGDCRCSRYTIIFRDEDFERELTRMKPVMDLRCHVYLGGLGRWEQCLKPWLG